MKTTLENKTYIGKVEAFEIMLDRGIEKLPRKNQEIHTVPSIASGLDIKVLGKDTEGFYTATYSQ